MDAAPQITLEDGRAILASQPFSRLLGARLVQLEPGLATLELDLTDDLRQQHGVAHGGVLAYLADNALSFCGGSTLGASLRSSGFTIEMLRPARTGPLRAEATTVVSTRRHAVCRCEITGPEGTYAVAQGRVTAVA
jgi:uncharacterized protein (TIGR00369 family)